MLLAEAALTPPALPWIAPFAALLIAIAVLPLAAPHFWESNRNKGLVAAATGLPVLVLLLATHATTLGHTALEYAQFMILIGSLFVISANILVNRDIEATPFTNVRVLGAGALLANLVGTTGASMLLIRPLIRINSERRHTTHTFVFFIFLVSNTGGCLTPLGDPPLFLGYLRGVPFTWTLRLWPEWLFVVGTLLAIYYLLDRARWAKETPADQARDRTTVEPLRIEGWHSFFLLGAVVAAVAFLGTPAREGVMLAAAAIAYFSTPARVREGNGFSFGPIIEVAVLFAGIFVTMVPALQILEANAGRLGLLREPWHFFVATGSLSSFLDNAPTYLTFLSVAKGLGTAALPAGTPTIQVDGAAIPEPYLVAISLGAVFMGANTYIGNGPNFMVKAICESAGVKMPTFFGYMGWAMAVLVPVWVAVALIFM